jgi:hypothetical protein
MSKIHYSVQVDRGVGFNINMRYVTDGWDREEVIQAGHDHFEDDITSGYLIGVDEHENVVERVYMDFGCEDYFKGCPSYDAPVVL